MVTPQDLLVRAYDLLGEFGICRGHYAVDGNGEYCPSTDPRAQSFCSVGAISRASYDLIGTYDLEIAGKAFLKLQPDVAIIDWNDGATDEEILATFRKAAGLPEPSKPVEELTEAHEQVLELV